MGNQQHRLRSHAPLARARLLPRAADEHVEPQPVEQRQLLRYLKLDVGLMVAGREIEEVVRRILMSGRQSDHDRATQCIVAQLQHAVLRVHLDIAREEMPAARGPDDRLERVRRVGEDGIEPLGGGRRSGLAEAIQLVSCPRVHAYQRHIDANGDAIRDSEVERERGYAFLRAHEHPREVVAAGAESLDRRA